MLKIGVIGIGNMGAFHAQSLLSGRISGAVLAAVCDVDNTKSNKFAGVPFYKSHRELLAAGVCDAVIIATPHYFHPPIAVDCFEAGLHVLTEKPAGVYEAQVAEMNAAAARAGRVFSIMLNQRTEPIFVKLRELVKGGELGKILRLSWVVTNWFREQEYYDSGDWRGTYAGEGGGVLLNQAVHNIDVWQWIMGVPERVSAHLGFGKYHDISVEDDATIYAEYSDGATAVFTTSTGERHGVNRLEIVGTGGRLLAENGRLTLGGEDVTPEGDGAAHEGILRNFAAACTSGEPLIARGEEGMNAVRIINAAYLSAWCGAEDVTLPAPPAEFLRELQKRQTDGKNCAKKQAATADVADRWRVKW